MKTFVDSRAHIHLF